jgi:hypothetical protein
MASAGDKGFASLRHRAGQDFRPLPTDLPGDALEICVQGFRQLRPGRLGPRGSQVSERLDPATAPFLVMPEIEVRPPADRLRGHATTDLHGLRIALTLLKVNPVAIAKWAVGGPTPRFPLETFMAVRLLPMAVGRPLGFPHGRRGRDLGPPGVRGPSDH